MGGFNAAWFVAIAVAIVLMLIPAGKWRKTLWVIAAFCFLVGIGGLAMDFHAAYELRLPFISRRATSSDSLAEWSAKPLKQVWNKTFQGQTVVLDGYEYINCTFDDVTFEYNGTALTRLTQSTILRHGDGERMVQIRSPHPIVNQTLNIAFGLSVAQGIPQKYLEQSCVEQSCVPVK